MNTPNEVLSQLAARDFASLIGLPESVWLDAKETPYMLDTPKQKLELAKDVSSLANAEGGIIVIGFDTERKPETAGEYISEVCPFPLSLVDPDRYMKILAALIYPPPHEVRIQTFENGIADGKGIAAIVVEAMPAGRPYVVGSMLDETGQALGAYFGFFERKRDVIPPVSIARIQQQLSAGLQWSSINDRLSAIEGRLASWEEPPTAVKLTGITKDERDRRLKEARVAAGMDEGALIYLMASAESGCDFPTLFKSHTERVVRLIEDPPQLRQGGFEIWADKESQIVEGRFRRSMFAKSRLIELWKDGLFIFLAEGDADFLGWSTGTTVDQPLRIRNFVLAEAVLHFCWLIKLVFDEAQPKPAVIRLEVGFDNLDRAAGRAILSGTADRNGITAFPWNQKTAPASPFEVSVLAKLDEYDAELKAFLLLEQIYHRFGFNSESVPYAKIESGVSKIDSFKIIDKALPTES